MSIRISLTRLFPPLTHCPFLTSLYRCCLSARTQRTYSNCLLYGLLMGPANQSVNISIFPSRCLSGSLVIPIFPFLSLNFMSSMSLGTHLQRPPAATVRVTNQSVRTSTSPLWCFPCSSIIIPVSHLPRSQIAEAGQNCNPYEDLPTSLSAYEG